MFTSKGLTEKTTRPIHRPSVLRALGSLLLALSATVVPLATTSAAVKLTNGASASTSIYCSQSMQWMRETITMKPVTGLSSQTVSWRQFIQPIGGTGFWTAWTNRTAPFTTTYVTNVSNANFHVYMQYAWYRNGAWTYAGEWIQSYGQTYGSSISYLSYCAV